MNKFLFTLIFTSVLSTLLIACSASPSTTGAETSELRIAFLIDDGNPNLEAVFDGFSDDLAKHIGMPVTIVRDATHLVGIEAMRAGHLDIMWGSPFVYLLAERDIEVERIVTTNNPNLINKSVFITSNDNIQSMEDLRGHSFAFVTPASASGFLYPMYHLISEFDMDRDGIMMDFFSATTFSGSQNTSVMGVVHGDFDAAAVGNIQLNSMLASGIINADDFRILGDTEIIPWPGYIASSHLGDELISQIRDFFINYDNDEYFMELWGNADTTFILPDEAVIEHLRTMVTVLDIDLAGQD